MGMGKSFFSREFDCRMCFFLLWVNIPYVDPMISYGVESHLFSAPFCDSFLVHGATNGLP